MFKLCLFNGPTSLFKHTIIKRPFLKRSVTNYFVLLSLYLFYHRYKVEVVLLACWW